MVDEPCPVCRKVCLDSFGEHAVHCKELPGFKYRHDLVRDVLYDVLKRARISSRKEAPVNFLTDPLEGRSTLWPADILVFGWAEGKHAYVDLTGVSPLVGLRDNGFVAGQAALKAESSKVAKHEKACLENQHVFIPFAFDTFGFLAPEVEEFLNRVQRVVQMTDDFSSFTWVFFLASKDETYGILKRFIIEIENQSKHKVKVIRCDNGTEFKNKEVNEFCRLKGIKREFSVARTPQQNGVAERKNRTLIEAARTMLADSLLPTVFWAEAVNTACYVLNRVLVTKPHNKTPYELIIGRSPSISFMRPFGCPVTILNTLDPLGKFDGKAEEGFLVGYSVNSKAFRVFNSQTRKVEENLHVNFLENKPNVVGQGPNWLFDIDSLTNFMNYQLVTVGNQTNKNAGPHEANGNTGLKQSVDAKQSEENNMSTQQYVVFPLWSSISSSYKSSDENDTADDSIGESPVQKPTSENEHALKNVLDKMMDQENEATKQSDAVRKEFETQCNRQNLSGKATKANSTNSFNTVSIPVNAASASRTYNDAGPSFVPLGGSFPDDPLMPDLEDTAEVQNTLCFSLLVSSALDPKNLVMMKHQTMKMHQTNGACTKQTTTVIHSNILLSLNIKKLPILKKEENGNSKKRISTRKDGVIRILPPVTAAEIQAVEKERKAKNILLMAIPKEHMRRFHGMDDAKEIWEPIRTSSEGLEKGYDRFQQLLSQLEAHGAEVSTEDANHKFLRSLPPACKSSTNRVKSGFTSAYNICTPTSSTNTPEKEALAGFADEIDDLDIEEMDINWQIAMIAIRIKKFYKKYRKEEKEDSVGKPLYSRFIKTNDYKGVPHPLSGDYTPKPQEEIDESLYCKIIGTSSEHSFDPEFEISRVPKEVYVSKPITINEKGVSTPKSKEVEPSCVSHIKTPRQPIKDQETPKVNRKNWNAMKERELGEGAAEFKKQRVFNTGNRVEKLVWINDDKINHANQFVPRSVQLNTDRPNINSVRPNINTGRTNINYVRPRVNTVNTVSSRQSGHTGPQNALVL
ncbi:putative ribonuclease H-like domain-containing protein [Tanacetum coccineum]